MLTYYLIPVFILVSIYINKRLLFCIKSCSAYLDKPWISILVIILYFILSATILLEFYMEKFKLRRLLGIVGYNWLGILLVIIIAFTVFEVFCLVLMLLYNKLGLVYNKDRIVKTAAVICLIVICGLSIYGMINARNIQTTDYHLSINKSGGNVNKLNAVMISDLHIGYNLGNKELQDCVDKINELHPDIVFIAGDIFDNRLSALDDRNKTIELLKSINSKYGTYACLGNHDIERKILAGFTFELKDKSSYSTVAMEQILKDADITLLKDETVLIDDSFYVCGRVDYDNKEYTHTDRQSVDELLKGLDTTKPIIVLDHQPKEYDELSKAGVDLDLSGHTHAGQLFPANILMKKLWENSYGYMKVGSMHTIVTSGLGAFGPYMRIGTKSEICNIEIEFIN